MNNFFENFKRNASDAADKAVKKTNELTTIAKLNVNVKTAESKLSAVYEEIGRMFYNAERTGLDCTGDIADRIMQADKLKADIASYKNEIAKLRKVVVCEGCGEEIADEYTFCPKCGMKQIKPEPEIEVEYECCCDEEQCDCDGECDCGGNCHCGGECDCDGNCDCDEGSCECGCCKCDEDTQSCDCETSEINDSTDAE